MNSIIIEPTATAQWQSLIAEAQKASNNQLSEDCESYLVFLMMRFLSRSDVANNVMAIHYLTTQLQSGVKRVDGLRDVGDQCLLISGLFPKRALKRRVKISYFVDLGRSAYHEISENVSSGLSDFYRHLAQEFICLRDVLQAVRELGTHKPELNLLESFELWNETGSKKALSALQESTSGTLIPNFSTKLN